jgi:hypothetical protein
MAERSGWLPSVLMPTWAIEWEYKEIIKTPVRKNVLM